MKNIEFGGKYLDNTVRRRRLLRWVPVDRLLQGARRSPSVAIRDLSIWSVLSLGVGVCRRPMPVPLPLVSSIESAGARSGAHDGSASDQLIVIDRGRGVG
jgi:hypothetical protein